LMMNVKKMVEDRKSRTGQKSIMRRNCGKGGGTPQPPTTAGNLDKIRKQTKPPVKMEGKRRALDPKRFRKQGEGKRTEKTVPPLIQLSKFKNIRGCYERSHPQNQPTKKKRGQKRTIKRVPIAKPRWGESTWKT